MTLMVFWMISVAPREGRVSRNVKSSEQNDLSCVAPREGRVSRNIQQLPHDAKIESRPARGV